MSFAESVKAIVDEDSRLDLVNDFNPSSSPETNPPTDAGSELTVTTAIVSLVVVCLLCIMISVS